MNKTIKPFLPDDSLGFDCVSRLKFGFVWHSGSTGVTAFIRWVQRVTEVLLMHRENVTAVCVHDKKENVLKYH